MGASWNKGLPLNVFQDELFHYVLLSKVQTKKLIFLQRLQRYPCLATGLYKIRT